MISDHSCVLLPSRVIPSAHAQGPLKVSPGDTTFIGPVRRDMTLHFIGGAVI